MSARVDTFTTFVSAGLTPASGGVRQADLLTILQVSRAFAAGKPVPPG